MKAIDYLKEISKLDIKINTEMQELEVLETLATRTTSILGGDKVQSSGKRDRVGDYTEKIIEKKEQIMEKIAEWIGLKNESQQLLGKCDADCMMLIYRRYFKREGWEEIAFEMNFTYQWVSGGLHKKALAQFQKALDERSS